MADDKAKESAEGASTKGEVAASGGLRIPLPTALFGLGVLAAAAPHAEAATAVNDSYHLHLNQSLTGVNVTANDSFSTPYTVNSLGSMLHGSMTLDTAGNLTYTPNNNFVGIDRFSYRLQDETSNSFGNVMIFVGAPQANNDSYTLNENSTLSGVNILANDQLFGNGLVLVHGPASHGTALVDSVGNLVYTPNFGFVGLDTFEYTVSDEFGNSSAEVSLLVDPLPTAVPAVDAAALAGLSGLLALFGIRRRRK